MNSQKFKCMWGHVDMAKKYTVGPIKLWNRKTTYRVLNYNFKQSNEQETQQLGSVYKLFHSNQ